MFPVLISIILIGAILLIAVVLLQPGKGDLTATFGGLSAQFGAVFGMQKATDLLAKITKIMAAIILILVLLTNKFFVVQHVQQSEKPVTEGVKVPANLQQPPAQPNVPQQQQQPGSQQGR